MAILQHNWTGSLAIYASLPAQPLAMNQQVKGVNVSKNINTSKGSWIKAATNARLRVHADTELQSSFQISLHLQEHVLLQCQLCSACIRLALLPCSQQQTSILVLMPAQQEAAAAPVTHCFKFYDQQDCSSFLSALQAMRTQQAVLHQPQQYHQQPQHPGPAPTAAALEADSQAVPAAGCQVGQAAAAPPTEPKGPSPMETNEPVVGLPLHLPQGDGAKEAIKRFLTDPAFQRYVETVEAVWDEVEEELEQQGLLATTHRGLNTEPAV